MHKLINYLCYALQIVKRGARQTLNSFAEVANRYLSDRHGYRRILQMIEQVPQSNGSRIFTREDARVGIVADPFVLENFEPTCHLVPLLPDKWNEQIQNIDCILIVSAWKGVAGEWAGLAKHDSEISRTLIQLMQAGKRAHLPVVFYSKEDPPNYAHFLPYAQQATCIFTSAQEALPWYQRDCLGIPVDVLTFAVNPLLHNPIGSEGVKMEGTVFFAGSWMPKYPERIQTQRQFFAWIRRSGMKFSIADRNFERRDFRYRYPLRYLPRVMAGFTYHQVSCLYRIFPWVLNINSVTHSQTMFAMRVYDACACGAHVISNESPGMQRLLPEVSVIQSYEDFFRAVNKPERILAEEKMQAIRRILGKDTVYHRMEQILKAANLPRKKSPEPWIGVLLDPALNEEECRNCYKMFERQSWKWKCLADSQEKLDSCQIVTIWGAKRTYGQFYLEDMANGFKYTSCDYVTKPGKCQAHSYTDRIEDIYATLFWADCAPDLVERARQNGDWIVPDGYASDRENYQCSAMTGVAV